MDGTGPLAMSEHHKNLSAGDLLAGDWLAGDWQAGDSEIVNRTGVVAMKTTYISAGTPR